MVAQAVEPKGQRFKRRRRRAAGQDAQLAMEGAEEGAEAAQQRFLLDEALSRATLDEALSRTSLMLSETSARLAEAATSGAEAVVQLANR